MKYIRDLTDVSYCFIGLLLARSSRKKISLSLVLKPICVSSLAFIVSTQE